MAYPDGHAYYYPDHEIENLDIAGREYDLAANTVRAKSATLGALTALYAIASSVAGLIGLTNPSDLAAIYDQLAKSELYVRPSLLLVLVATAYGVSASLANARVDYVVSARKIIIIRQLANVRFGRDNLILPSWRLEAAIHPHVVRLFEGWKLHHLFPLVFTLVALGWLLALVLLTYGISWQLCALAGIGLAGTFTIYYRSRLFERNENFLLLITYAIADLLDLTLDKRRAYVLYRARLAVLEAKRLEINYNALKKMIVFREDRSFESNIGISLRGIMRALYQTVCKRSPQGGSTISQQLFRSLYVMDYNKRIRRKIAESFGAFWLKSSLDNNEILELYICCVRYGPDSYGLMEARKTLKISSEVLTPHEAFVLAERVSNVGKNVRWGGIEKSLEDGVRLNLLTSEERIKVIDKYHELIQNGVLSDAPKQT